MLMIAYPWPFAHVRLGETTKASGKAPDAFIRSIRIVG
jgi:hypothetical protein